MSRSNKKKSYADLADLEARFLDGERLTIDQVVADYFQPKNYMEGLTARDTARGYVNQLKKRFTQIHGVWFGNINPEHQYGIPATRGEFAYSVQGYKNRIIGTVKRAVQVWQDGVDKKMITSNQKQTLFLPVVPVEDAVEGETEKVLEGGEDIG